MSTAIRSYDEQAFDNMSEKSGKKNFIVKKSLRPVPSQSIGWAGQITWRFQTPESEVAEDGLMKDIIK